MSDTASPERITFIYNADSGIGSALLDSVHKLVSPSTYACSLCEITYGMVAMDPKWRRWLKALPVPTRFLHRDELASALPAASGLALPVIVSERGDAIDVLIDADRMRTLGSLDALIAALEQALGQSSDGAGAGISPPR